MKVAMTESEIRNILVKQLADSPAGSDAAFISEMFLAGYSRRADLIMANGKLSVFEIKSPLDTLDRLEGQLENYLQHFEQVTVVCAEKHLEAVLSSTPNAVGVWSISSEGEISVRKKSKFLKVCNHKTWLSFLPVSEIKPLLKTHSLPANGAREDLVNSAFSIPLAKVRKYVLESLKCRDERIVALKEKQKNIAELRRIDRQAQEKRIASMMSAGHAGDTLKAIPRTPR